MASRRTTDDFIQRVNDILSPHPTSTSTSVWAHFDESVVIDALKSLFCAYHFPIDELTNEGVLLRNKPEAIVRKRVDRFAAVGHLALKKWEP